MNALMVTLLMTVVVASLTAATTSVRMVSRIWFRHWLDQQADDPSTGTPTAESLTARPIDYLLAAGTGVAVASFALGALIAFRSASGVVLLRQLLVAAVLLVLVGQVLPRTLAMRWGTRFIPVLAPFLRALHVMFGPILAFASRLVQRRRLPAERSAAAPADPLADLLREAEAEGIGAGSESEIISGVVEFGEKRVRDVMTPRERVTSVDASMPGDGVARAIAASNYSRIPVFGTSPNDVLGVVHAFDVLAQPDNPLAGLRPAAAATSDELCGVVMRRMLREHRHLAVVESGGAVVGIVTLEDLMEELVGEIRDEHDEPGLPG